MRCLSFTCTDPVCNKTQEDLFLQSETPPDAQPCKGCGKPAKRDLVYAIAGVRLPNNPGSYVKG
jgi:hypothetical protein